MHPFCNTRAQHKVKAMENKGLEAIPLLRKYYCCFMWGLIVSQFHYC